jgi:hypothetical protein
LPCAILHERLIFWVHGFTLWCGFRSWKSVLYRQRVKQIMVIQVKVILERGTLDHVNGGRYLRDQTHLHLRFLSALDARMLVFF